MSAERTRTELRITKDTRLLAGVRGAVEFVALRDGLGETGRAGLVAAAEQAARTALAHLDARHPDCTIIVEDFDDRIEVRLEYPGKDSLAAECESAGADRRTAKGTEACGAELMKRVDRVLYGTRNDGAYTTLVKYFNQKA